MDWMMGLVVVQTIAKHCKVLLASEVVSQGWDSVHWKDGRKHRVREAASDAT